MVRIRQLGCRKGVKMEESAARSAPLDENYVLKKIETAYGGQARKLHCMVRIR
jgi:hypothetical protein